jgi:hypothetical protein
MKSFLPNLSSSSTWSLLKKSTCVHGIIYLTYYPEWILDVQLTYIYGYIPTWLDYIFSAMILKIIWALKNNELLKYPEQFCMVKE